MIRQYHGCTIESTLAPCGEVWSEPPKGELPELLCDGWTHSVSRKGRSLGDYPTLAAAIAEAKRTRLPAEPSEHTAPDPIRGDEEHD